MKITAVVVTRGDRDISQVTDSLKSFDEIIVWDNSKTPKDLKVLGRYVGAYIARNDHIYIQDDDCLIDSTNLVREYVKGISYPIEVLSNFPRDRRAEYSGTGITLLGWGSIFHKTSLRVFSRYLEKYPFDDLFLRECDRVFSYLTQVAVTDVGLQHLLYAYGDDRMGRESRHREDFIEICKRLKTL